ncbi:hypothetical protein EJB05_30544, partial [Eragrostis curvula]
PSTSKIPNPAEALTPPSSLPTPSIAGVGSASRPPPTRGGIDPAMDDTVLFDDLRPSKPPPASFYDDMFESYFDRAAVPPEPSPKASSSSSTPPPVFDKPVFDDDPDAVNPFYAIPLFGGGSGGGGGEGEEDFVGGLGSEEKSEGRREPEAVGFDDLFPGLGGRAKSTEPVRDATELDQEAVGFDDDSIAGFGGSTKPATPVLPEVVDSDDGVIPGLGGSTNHHDSARDDPITRQESESISFNKTSVSPPEDPFVILGAMPKSEYSSFGLFSDHLDNISMPPKSENTKVDASINTTVQSSDIFAGFPKAMPSFSSTSEKESDTTGRRSVDSINSMSQSNHVLHGKPVQRASAQATVSILPEMNVSEPSVIHEVHVTTDFHPLNPFAMDDGLPEENQYADDVWLTVSDIVLVTQPTSAPPPSRPPPPLATKQPPMESVTSKSYAPHHNQGYHHSVDPANTYKTSQIDELEDFFMAKPAKFADGHPQVLNDEGTEQYSSTGAAWFMGQADLRHSKGMDQGAFGLDEKANWSAHEMEKTDEKRLENERKQREHEERQQRAEREREDELERERENMRQREQEEHQRAEREREEELEREREKARQREQEERKRREREREARQAVEKAIREARERAATEARMRAEREARQRAERAAVQKAAAEARERAAAEARERAAKAAAEAKERAEQEARESAAAESRERAARAAAEASEKAAAESQEKAAAEARAKAERAAVEKAAAEARRRAERAAFERVAAEARQRAANEARERAAAEARTRENQQRTATAQPDLESFFGMPSRSSSASRSQTAATNPFDAQPQGNSGSGTVRKTSSGSASPFTQPSSSNLMDDLSSIFGAPSSSAVFQDLDGESEERRKARLERHQRTMERAAKALAEKNERDLQAQWEQEERHRIGETLDFEIKRWAAGKEGNLRALLSTLQYILWPECGWRPISLTDLITAASVKKEYRKATLCIHPDKVQQKGANLQQKYIAEKVFDLLKVWLLPSLSLIPYCDTKQEAWNKFNSEELF